MKEIVLFLWVVTNGDIALKEMPGWMSMEECETAAESFTARNPKVVSDIRVGMIAMCQEVPK